MVSYFNSLRMRSFVMGGGLPAIALVLLAISMLGCGDSLQVAPAALDTPHVGSVNYGGNSGPGGEGELLDGGGLGGG